MLVTATASLVLALAFPALAAGAGVIEPGPPATDSEPCVAMGITTDKARWGLDAKASVSNRPKSVLGKQPLVTKTSKQVRIDLVGQ